MLFVSLQLTHTGCETNNKICYDVTVSSHLDSSPSFSGNWQVVEFTNETTIGFWFVTWQSRQQQASRCMFGFHSSFEVHSPPKWRKVNKTLKQYKSILSKSDTSEDVYVRKTDFLLNAWNKCSLCSYSICGRGNVVDNMLDWQYSTGRTAMDPKQIQVLFWKCVHMYMCW